MSEGKIAIIGMSCRAPLCKDAIHFWQNIINGRECLTKLSGAPLTSKKNSMIYVPVAGVIPYYKSFDYNFFGISHNDAKKMDPQLRHMMEVAYEAIEHSGYVKSRSKKNIGVYIGARNSTYLYNLINNQEYRKYHSVYDDRLYTSPEFIATRISHHLNLIGPSMTIESACSGSLVSVIESCKALLAYDCDMAVSGGVSLTVPHAEGYWYQDGFIYSRSGQCRPFDAAADGTILTSGVGAIILKRFSDAIKDADEIYATIDGYGINNDGKMKASYASPSKRGQIECVTSAIEHAGVDVGEIRYVEAHGTGTVVGDPIEFAALNEAFKKYTLKSNYCYIGSVKANVGHADAAAGILGVIKTAFILYYQTIPPQINYCTPNRNILLDNSPFLFHTDKKCSIETLKFAGVSSLGIGGTNAHIVLSSNNIPLKDKSITKPALALFSNENNNGLNASINAVKQYVRSEECMLNLSNVLNTLQSREEHFYRKSFVVNDVKEMDHLSFAEHSQDTGSYNSRPIIFVFSGQNAYYSQMGYEILNLCPLFKYHLDRAISSAKNANIDIHNFFYEKNKFSSEMLKKTEINQAVAFSVQYALGTLLIDSGITPTLLIGHSLGELIAAAVSQHLSLDDCFKLINARTKLFNKYGKGAMIRAPLTTKEAQSLQLKVTVAAENIPSEIILTGTKNDIEASQHVIEEYLLEVKKHNQKIDYFSDEFAFHSEILHDGKEEFLNILKTIDTFDSELKMFSTSILRVILLEKANDVSYWFHQICQPVLFRQAINETQMLHPNALYLDISPSGQLGAAIIHNGVSTNQTLSMLRKNNEWRNFLTCLGTIWENGNNVDWSKIHTMKKSNYLLPPYPFQKNICWINPDSEVDNSSLPGNIKPFYVYQPQWSQYFPLRERDETICKTDTFLTDNIIFYDPYNSLKNTSSVIYEFLRLNDKIIQSLDETAKILALHDDEFVTIVSVPLVDPPKEMIKKYNDFFINGINYFSKFKTVKCVFLLPNLNGLKLSGGSSLFNDLISVFSRTLASEYSIFKTAVLQYKAEDLSSVVCLISNMSNIIKYGKSQRYAASDKYIWNYTYKSVEIDTSVKEIANGCYVIFGGAGGVGFAIAEYISLNSSSEIILVGRNFDKHRDKINKLKTIADDVLIIKADISVKSGLEKAFDRCGLKDKTIELFIHSAGLPGGALMGEEALLELDKLSLTKITGTRNILSLAQQLNVKKTILFSSISAHIGSVGQFAYSAVNAAQESIGYNAYMNEGNVQVIAWDVWSNLGMSQKLFNSSHVKTHSFLDKSAALTAFNIISNSNYPLLIVSGVHWEERVTQDYIKLATMHMDMSIDKQERDLSLKGIRSHLRSIWAKTFDQDTLDESLFLCQLGGNSLDNLRLLNQVNQYYNIDMTLTFFLQHGTIEKISSYIYANQGKK